MKILRYISRIIIGIVFIFSGTVKAIDPLGTVYKLQDYFQAFNLGFLKDLALILAILLCTAEFIAGFSVLFNIRQKYGIWIVMLFMTIFTPLTFVLAMTNPVSDCGCFGDAIHLTNWQTFAKNIILLIPALFLFITRKEISTWSGITREWATVSIIAIFFFVFIFYNLRYLPAIDFLPYKTGTHIADKMVIPEGMPGDKYETTFFYSKAGEIKEFTLDNYPANDTSWKFIDHKYVIVSKGYEPPIHDFSLTSINGDDLTEQILSSGKYTLLMISKKLGEAEPELLRKGFELGYYCMGNLVDFYVITASGSDEIRKFNNGISFCLADETTLKTMIRANPGYILLKDGTILHKWSWAAVPGKEKIIELTNKL
jgi:hypothetical protein